jgi:hypothetical protein
MQLLMVTRSDLRPYEISSLSLRDMEEERRIVSELQYIFKRHSVDYSIQLH